MFICLTSRHSSFAIPWLLLSSTCPAVPYRPKYYNNRLSWRKYANVIAQRGDKKKKKKKTECFELSSRPRHETLRFTSIISLTNDRTASFVISLSLLPIKHQAPAPASAKAGLVYCSGCDTSVVGLRVKCSRTRHLLVTAPRSVADLPL